MKKLLLTILLNVLLLLPVVVWGGVHSCNSCEEWTSSETVGLQIRASESSLETISAIVGFADLGVTGITKLRNLLSDDIANIRKLNPQLANDTEYAYLYDETNKFLRILDEADEVSGMGRNIFSTLNTEINVLSKEIKSHAVLEAEYFAKYGNYTNYPYLKTAPVEDIVVSTNTKFVRLHDAGNINREWMMSIDDFNAHIDNGGTLDDLVDKLALPTKPTKISLVEVPANEVVRKSVAGPQQWSNIPYQNGGYTQYQIIGYNQINEIPLSWYSQTSDINSIIP